MFAQHGRRNAPGFKAQRKGNIVGFFGRADLPLRVQHIIKIGPAEGAFISRVIDVDECELAQLFRYGFPFFPGNVIEDAEARKTAACLNEAHGYIPLALFNITKLRRHVTISFAGLQEDLLPTDFELTKFSKEQAMEDCFFPEGILELAKKLCAYKSVTGTQGENEIARFIYGFFHNSEYFKDEENLAFIPVETNGLKRSAVLAFVEAAHETKRTVILNGHFDVVDADVCGDLTPIAFDPDLYTLEIGRHLPKSSDAWQDWESGNWLFGRGVMDMKFGLAMYMAYIRHMAGCREQLNVNLLFLAVPDEEGDSAGMRGALPFLCSFARKRRLELVAALSGEPAFWRESGPRRNSAREWFTGTTGKIMPLFFCIGHEAHAGYAFEGVSSAVMASHIVLSMDGNRDFSDAAGTEVLPPPVCLKLKDLRENYSVTLPEKSIAYFNVLTVSKTPRVILDMCRKIANAALDKTLQHIRSSAEDIAEKMGREAVSLPEWKPAVFTVEEIKRMAALKVQQSGRLSKIDMSAWEKEIIDSLPNSLDAREKGIALLDRLIVMAGLKGPAIVIGFVPPFYPHRLNMRKSENEQKLRNIMETLKQNIDARVGQISLLECFSGIMDLSFMGFQGKEDDLEDLAANMPGWGSIFSFPVHDLATLDVPIASVGPAGKDAHQATERLELDYSLRIAPEILTQVIGRLGKGQ